MIRELVDYMEILEVGNKDEETTAALYAVLFSLYKSGELTADPRDVCGEIANVLKAIQSGKTVEVNEIGDITFLPAGSE